MPKKIMCAVCDKIVDWELCYITTNVDSVSIVQAFVCEECWIKKEDVVL